MLNGILPASWQGHTHAALRIMTGLLFLQHGTMKILGFPITEALKGMIGGMPSGMLYFTGLMELVGGVLIIIGFLTRSVAFILSGYMAVAYFMFYFGTSFIPLINGGEYEVLLCFVFLWLAAAGAGPYSLDDSRK